jgi:hypothetical protein
MELSPEEQSFFDAGDELSGPTPVESEPRRQRSGRRSRRHASSRFRRQLRNSRWGKTLLSAVLTIAAVWAGYWATMQVSNRDMPSPSELGVVGRGH